MAINVTREKYYLKFKNEVPPGSFKHEPPPSKPTQPTFPSTLTVPQQTSVKNWRQARGSAKATLYAGLTGAALTKADEFIAWDKLRSAWESNDRSARQEQWAWFKADSAISNEPTVPKSGSDTGTGSGAPANPQTKQEP